MNGFCRTLDCFFGPQFNESADSGSEWNAIQVYRDGNVIHLGTFATEEEAEDFAGAERERQLQDNGQFGVGA